MHEDRRWRARQAEERNEAARSNEKEVFKLECVGRGTKVSSHLLGESKNEVGGP